MSEVFPYQLVGFLDKEPEVGEPVYGGVNGWYPQIALKRRFNVPGMSEPDLLESIQRYCSFVPPLTVVIGNAVCTERMPVKVLEVAQTPELMEFHAKFIESFQGRLVSRYPERDGANYYPHITAEYDGLNVIPEEVYANTRVLLTSVWLLKDEESENSNTFARFALG